MTFLVFVCFNYTCDKEFESLQFHILCVAYLLYTAKLFARIDGRKLNGAKFTLYTIFIFIFTIYIFIFYRKVGKFDLKAYMFQLVVVSSTFNSPL